MANPVIPTISTKYFCIASRNQKVLSAVVASYLIESNQYLSLFQFPNSIVPKPQTEVDVHDVNYISINRGNEFSVRLFNSLQRLRTCEYIILIGLDENQKSYLDFLDEYNVISVESLADVDYLLKSFSSKSNYLLCKAEEACLGLYLASIQNALMKIDASAQQLSLPANLKKEGLIVIEDENDLSPVIGVAYAISIDAGVSLISPLEIGRPEVKFLIEKWKDEEHSKYFDELVSLIYSRIEFIKFEIYQFATFFSSGFPYGLVLKNIIPFSHVNNQLHPDLFIFNNLYVYHQRSISSAVVFSPLEFGLDEETGFVIKKLQQNSFVVKQSVGKKATVYNLSNIITEYPYEILHICSHGGEVKGSRITQQYEDRDGNKHEVEYDRVLSFAPSKHEKLIEVTSKYIFRKFDGLIWKSAELDALPYPHYVFNDMMKAISEKKERKGVIIPVVEGSCSIKCSDFNYQAMFNSIAGYHSNPVIFNNTCWSWSDISDSFLSVGSSGYIGTLWAVNNQRAVEFAESFYEFAFSGTILNAFHRALTKLEGTKSENIYLFWGLHFAVIKTGGSIPESRMKITSRLLDAFYRWHDRLAIIQDEKTKSQIQRLENWIQVTLREDFPIETISLVSPPSHK